MLDDLVIDTNVFMHATDPRQQHQTDCLRVIELMRTRATRLCVDEGTNQQRPLEGFIMSEYRERLAHGTPGRELLASLLAATRVVALPRKVSRPVAKQLEQIRNTRDRKFVAVAHNSIERVLASQDFYDFSRATRQRVRNQMSVRILEASECADILEDDGF